MLRVNIVKKIAAWLLLAVWLPVTSHCLLELAEFIPLDDCCAASSSSTGSHQDGADDACNTLESASYKVDDNAAVLIPPAVGLLVCVLAPLEDLSVAAQFSSDFLTVAPPNLPVTWQFSYRAALPIRAPSAAS